MSQISIITVNLNNAVGLKRTIESVVSQSYSDFEYIIIDGASSDGSVEVIKKFESKISQWGSEKDYGIYHAMNKGIAKASGDYCLFLNSGDYLFNNDVLQKACLIPFQEDIIYGDMMINYGDGKIIHGRQPEKITFEFMIEATLWHPVSFIRKDLLIQSGGYNEKYKIISDYEFFLKAIILNKATTRHVPMPIAVFSTDGIGSSEKYADLHDNERNGVLQKYFSEPVLETAYEYNQLKKSFSVKFAERISKHSFLKAFALFSYRVLNRILKLFGA